MKRFNRFILDEAAKPKLTFNRGHAYEFVLAAAMVARFTDRWDDGTPRELDASSVEEVMAGYFMRGGEKEIWTVSDGDGVEDTVEFDGSGLPTDVLAALGEKTIRDNPDVKKMVTTAIKAVAGNTTLTKLSTKVIKNGIKDTIMVVCGGTVGQMSTKSDIDLYVNETELKGAVLKGIDGVDLPKTRAVGFSVKWGGVEQVGQWSGVNLDDNIIKAFTSFGMKITSGDVTGVAMASGPTSGFVGTGYKGRKDSQVEKDKNIIFLAVRTSFGKISTKNKPVEFKKPATVNKLIKGIKESISGAPKKGKPAEQDIELVRNAASINRASYDALAKGLRTSAADPKSNLRWVLGTKGNPTMQLHVTIDNETKILFQIRCRYDADPIDKKKTKYKARFRILAELGTDIWDFIAYHKK